MLIHSRFKFFQIILILMLSTVACNMPGSSISDLDEKNIANTAQDTENFIASEDLTLESATPDEFIEACGQAGGRVQQLGAGWACNFETGQDIVCDIEGHCTFGQVPDIVVANYAAVAPPALEEIIIPEDFAASCEDSGGSFFSWGVGVGCDFEETIDVFCGPEDGACGLGWVVEIPPSSNGVSLSEVENGVVPATMFAPAFVQGEPVGDKIIGDPLVEFVLERKVILNIFEQQTTGNLLGVALTSDDDDEVEEEDDFPQGAIDLCTAAGGTANHVVHGDSNLDYVVCDYNDGKADVICDNWGCYPDPEFEGIINEFSFDKFEEAFTATQVHIILAGASDLAPDINGLERDWNQLYTSVIEMNGIVPRGNNVSSYYFTLPGTVSIFPNGENTDAPPANGIRLVFDSVANIDSPTSGLCDALPPSPIPCIEPIVVGLMLPISELVYYVEPSTLPMPELFTGIEIFELRTASSVSTPESNAILSITPTSIIDKLEPVTAAEEANCRSGPGSVYPIIGILVPEEEVTVLGRNEQGDWAFVMRSEGSQCWVWEGKLTEDSDFSDSEIMPDPPTPTPPPTFTPTLVPPPTATSTSAPSDPQNASISGTVFKDVAPLGSMDGSDTGYSGISVTLGAGSCSSSGLASTNTNGSGAFSFSGLSAGTYCLKIVHPTAGSCPRWDHASTPTIFTLTLSAGESVSRTIGFDNSACAVD